MEKLEAWWKRQTERKVLLSSILPAKGTFPQVSVPPKSLLKIEVFSIHFQKDHNTHPQWELLPQIGLLLPSWPPPSARLPTLLLLLRGSGFLKLGQAIGCRNFETFYREM